MGKKEESAAAPGSPSRITPEKGKGQSRPRSLATRAGIAQAALWLAIAAVASAAEIDSVTRRGEVLADSARAIEKRLDGWIEGGVRRANEGDVACDPEALYRGVRAAIHFPLIGHLIAEELNAADDLDKRRVLLEDSIYRDLGLLEGISVHLKDLSAVIRIRDHVVGVDKIGHFLVQGWSYFEIAYREDRGIEAAMDRGESTERTYFGLYTTGVHSFADLAVNFDGMRFWLRLVGEVSNPLDEGFFPDAPYVSCRRRFGFGRPRWKVTHRVRIADYVSGAWDEGQNCSSYRNDDIAARIAARVAERGELEGRDYTCPVDPAACAGAHERYGPYADRLLHSRCLAAERPTRPWWRPW